METNATPAQLTYLADLGATDAQIVGLNKTEASALIDTLKAHNATAERNADLAAMVTGPITLADYRYELVERATPLRLRKPAGWDLDHEARIICPAGAPRMHVQPGPVTVDGLKVTAKYVSLDYRGEGGTLHSVPTDSLMADTILSCLAEHARSEA